MGSVDVTDWGNEKRLAALEAIDPQSRVKIVWEPPPQTPTEDPIDAARRLALQRASLKG